MVYNFINEILLMIKSNRSHTNQNQYTNITNGYKSSTPLLISSNLCNEDKKWC